MLAERLLCPGSGKDPIGIRTSMSRGRDLRCPDCSEWIKDDYAITMPAHEAKP